MIRLENLTGELLNYRLHFWTQLTQTNIVLNKFLQTLMRKFSKLKSFLAAGYPQKFVESVICNFENDNVESVEVDYIIPSGFFDIAKLVIIVEVHFFYKK